jgi:hypothetical protein
MKVEYLFSKNKHIGSRVISNMSSFITKGLDKYPSHVAVLLDDTFVIESTMLTGVRLIPYEQWKKINKELYKIPCERGDCPIFVIQELLFEMWGKKYDKLGLIWFGWQVFKYVAFKKSLPCKNEWEQEDKFFCTEFAGRLAGKNYSMTTPSEMLKGLLQDGKT